MNEFNPGDGWRLVPVGEAPPHDKESLVWTDGEGRSAWWVRVPPVPPLPTAPYTVIRAEGDAFEAVMILQPSGTWTTTSGNRVELRPADRRITGFEVLAVPRAVTAKAVLDRVRELHLTTVFDAFAVIDIVAREFGVPSTTSSP